MRVRNVTAAVLAVVMLGIGMTRSVAPVDAGPVTADRRPAR